MSSIKIRVGASLDANAHTVFQPLENAAERARKAIEKSFGTASKAPRQVEAATKSSGDRLIAEVEREADKIIRAEEKGQQGRVNEVKRAARERVQIEKAANAE